MASIKDLMNLSIDDVMSMNEKELRKTVSQMSSAANKRLARLGSTRGGQMSPSYKKTMERSYTTAEGGKFGVKGKNLNQLRNEYKSLKNFYNTKTGSVAGWKKYKKRVYDRIGGGFPDEQSESDFWRNYRLLEKEARERGLNYGSTELQTDLRRMMTVNEDTEDAVQTMIDRMDAMYEEENTIDEDEEFFTLQDRQMDSERPAEDNRRTSKKRKSNKVK